MTITVTPRTCYAKSGDVNIAYQTVGDGPFDLVFVPGYVSHLELYWEEPSVARFFERLASFSRLIVFDKRGTGLSDRVPVNELPTLEQRMDDVRAVMDAAGSEQAGLLGISEGGPMSVVFAATYPERTRALMLYGTFARGSQAEDYPHLPPMDEIRPLLEFMEHEWADGPLLPLFGPSVVGDRRFQEWWARMLRSAASPAAGVHTLELATQIDVRDVLPAIAVPTLVIHRADDVLVPAENGRYLAEHIPDCRYVELSGEDHLWSVGDQDEILDEVEEFLTGERHEREVDRVLATVLFTDIVGSTERASDLGDSRWRDLLEEHDRLVRRQLERFRGREIKTVGDGFLATFDGPARAVRCARSLTEQVRRLGIDIRAGLHTGECELVGEDVAGMAIHIGARVGASAGPGEVLVSNTVKDLVVGSGLEFADRGIHALKGVPGEWRLYAVRG